MSMLSSDQRAQEEQRAQTCREELVERIVHALAQDGSAEPLRGLFLFRASRPTEPLHGLYEPAFCVVAQGSKEVLLGDDRFRYDPAHYLLATVGLPTVSHIVEASRARPYLSLRLSLDLSLVSSVMLEAGYQPARSIADARAMAVSPLDAGLLDSVVRLFRLLDKPSEARFLAPLITREIVFRLLMGEQGERLRHMAVLSGNTHHMARAIDQLRQEFNRPLRVETLARELGMSISGFHHHFKAVTALSPLQFQKRLRLQEARRMLLGEQVDAASAAYAVGYDDASHFGREYKRLFGLSPLRDVERLRQGAVLEGAALERVA